MSRSYKHTPYCGDGKGKVKKRFANKSVRAWLKEHPEEILRKSSFKKCYEQYDICDWYFICLQEEKDFKWYKMYKMK